MLIDDVTIKVEAGKGGNGLATFNRNKFSLGPTGGDGGRGGDVYITAVNNIGALNVYRHKKEFFAGNGKGGGSQRKIGADGEPLILDVPAGTVITNLQNQRIYELKKPGEKILIAKGGDGGRGNYSFRSSRNTTPKQATPGQEGEAFDLHFELKLIADVGLVGFPNAGKSSLLNQLTNANSKVANYKFTTLEPSLGVFYELILADIPGLIEGASQGKGLGHKFLRHIERTKTLFHLVSAESNDPAGDYKKIRKELEIFNPKLLEKKEFVFLSKSDQLEEGEVSKKLKNLRKVCPQAKELSILKDETVEQVKTILTGLQAEKMENQ